MSFEGHPFRWLPSLQHMAKVKIIETLWRNCKAGQRIEKIVIKTHRLQLDPLFFFPMIGQIQIKFEGLEIPSHLESDLVWCTDLMIPKAIEWLSTTYLDNHPLKQLDEGWEEAICYFADNLCFNNFGCVDGMKTLESYVNGKEIVGHWVWHELCLYCIEDKIVEFSEKFNWQEGTNCLNWQCPVYWYRKIYGELPSDKMLTSCPSLQRDKERHVGAFCNGENIVRSMLEALTREYSECRSVAAIIHFRNQLNNDEEFNRLVAHSLSQPYGVGEVFIYLLRTITKDASLESITNYSDEILRKFTEWPWIFFINDWKRMFQKNINEVFFISFFHSMGLAIRRMTGQHKVVLYRVFQEIVGIFHERFISNRELIAEAFWKLLFKHDAGYMCKLMLEGVEKPHRKFVIKAMRHYVLISMGSIGNEISYSLIHSYTMERSSDFHETVDRVFSGEERALFWQIYDEYCSEKRLESSRNVMRANLRILPDMQLR